MIIIIIFWFKKDYYFKIPLNENSIKCVLIVLKQKLSILTIKYVERPITTLPMTEHP